MMLLLSNLIHSKALVFNFRAVYEFNNYIFYFNMITADQQIILIVLWFAISWIIITFLIVLIIQNKPSKYILHIFKVTQLIFYYVGIIPVLYGNLLFIYNSSICDASTFCSGRLAILIIIAIYNLIIALCLLSIQIYFQRADSILENSMHLILNYSILLEILENSLIIVLIILNVTAVSKTILRIIFVIFQIIRLLTRFKRISYENQKSLIIYAIQLVLSWGIILDLSLYEILIMIPIAISVVSSLHTYLLIEYTLTPKQANLATIQILNFQILEGKSSSIQIQSMMKKHICKKCKHPNHMIQCLLKQTMKDSPNQSALLTFYCAQIAEISPLKSLMRLIVQQKMFTNHYFQYARTNIINFLYNKIRSRQFDSKNKQQFVQNDHTAILDLYTVYESMKTPSIIFEQFQMVIESKIAFWHSLINGFQHIDNCIKQTLQTTELMQKCKITMNQRFDLKTNRLRESQLADIQSLRVIQIFYCAIYANSLIASQNEKDIEEMLKSERFKQDESLDNIQLIQNRIMVLSSSFISNRGQLLDVNEKQFASFFKIDIQKARTLKHVNQILPQFIANIHSMLMDNYLQKGYSKLVIHGEPTYYQNFAGFIEPCIIHQYNEHSHMNDYIVNLIVTKDQNQSDIVLFGMDGKILGVTKKFYELITQASEDSFTKSISINYLIEKGSIIQYYLPSIYQQILQLRQIITEQGNYTLNNLNAQWNFPSNHYDCIQSSFDILSSFRKRTIQEGMKSMKSMSFSRYSQSIIQKSQNSQVYDFSEFSQDMIADLKYGYDYLILQHPEIQHHIQLLQAENKNVNCASSINLTYTLQHRFLQYKNGCFGYFAIMIKDTKGFNQDKTVGYTQSSFMKTLINPSYLSSKQDDQIDGDVEQELVDVNIMNIHESVKFNQDLDSQINQQIKANIQNASQLDETRRLNISARQMLQQTSFIYPKKLVDHNFEDELEIEREMKELELNQELEYDEDNRHPDRKNSHSQSQQKVSDVFQKLRKTQQVQKQEHVEGQQSVDSKISSTSTSKESLIIVQHLYLSTNIVSPLKILIILLFSIGIGILTSFVLNVQLISDNLTNQTSQINIIRQPQNINYALAPIFQSLYTKILIQNQLEDISPFLQSQNEKNLVQQFSYSRANLQTLALQSSALAAGLNFQQFNSTYVDLQGQVQIQGMSFQNFYSRIYEQFETTYRDNLNLTNYNYSLLNTQSFIRQNFVSMIRFHDTLIQAIMESTISNQNAVPNQFLTIMFLEMFSVLIVIGIQLRTWLFIDHIKRSIIFLVSRLNETQAIEQITKLTVINQYVQDYNSNQWKIQDFTQIMFGLVDESKQSLVAQKSIKQKMNLSSYKASTSLYSRIQQNNYLNRNNVLITFSIAIVWSTFLMTGYLIHMSHNNQFQPSLTASLKYVKFRHSFDASVLLATLIKAESLIPGNNISLINQTDTILMFQTLYTSILPTINDVLTVVVKAAQQNGGTSIFDTALTQDLCPQQPTSLVMCSDASVKNQTQTSLAYYTSELYGTYLSKGTIGYSQIYINFIETEFNTEVETLKYQTNQTLLKNLVKQPFWITMTLQYLVDINAGFRAIVILFQTDNNTIANSIIQIISAYYYGAGIILLFIYIVLCIVWVYKAQANINSLAQILVLIPIESLLTANFKSHTKEIYQQLYE